MELYYQEPSTSEDLWIVLEKGTLGAFDIAFEQIDSTVRWQNAFQVKIRAPDRMRAAER
jgi:hypothetical protein